jgi:hypothetical protein
MSDPLHANSARPIRWAYSDPKRRNRESLGPPVSCRYTGPNENFVLVSGCSSGDLETNGFEERIQAIADLLIETVEGTALFFG